MTHRLDRMVARGLIRRTVDAENRTRMRVELAQPGWELFRHAIVDAEVVEGDILSALDPDEQRQLADLLEKLVAGLPEK
jgi:DNA-binding MarR family transcriptional regulator